MTFHFGNFEIDDGARRLSRDGAPVHVSPKAFDLLMALLQERPRVLSKVELHGRLWPNTFVSDASLAMLVAELRAALGESARQPRAIRTLHRRGYAFQGFVREGGGWTAPAATAPAAGLGYWLVTPARHVHLRPGEHIIGRDPQAAVWLDAPSVSRRHAAIRIDGERATIEDLGSKNGTRVGADRLRGTRPLIDGDEITFGSVKSTFRAWQPEPTRTEGEAQ